MAAGRAAHMAAWITGNMLGDWAVRSGWLARSLLKEAGEDGLEHGWMLIIKAFSEQDAQLCESLLAEMIAIGRRFRRPDIEFLGLALRRRHTALCQEPASNPPATKPHNATRGTVWPRCHPHAEQR